MSERTTENQAQITMEDIYAYIEKLSFKTVPFGGVDRDSALAAIQEINNMFSDVYDDLLTQLETLQNERAALRKRQSPLERELASLRTEKESLSLTIQKQMENVDKATETERYFRQCENELREELDNLRQKLREKDSQIGELEKKHARELELAKAGAAEKGETLEEIYLDARKQRAEMLQTAQEKAEEITRNASQEALQLRTSAEQEASQMRSAAEKDATELRNTAKRETTQLRTETEREISALRHTAEQEVKKLRSTAEQEAAEMQKTAQDEANQLIEQTELAARESAEQCRENETLAAQMVSDAKEERDRILESARQAYVQERKKYDAMRVQLGALRAKTVADIRADISNLTELVFGMTGHGIETDTFNEAGLANMDEDNANSDEYTQLELPRDDFNLDTPSEEGTADA